jgi:hypothetical protein
MTDSLAGMFLVGATILVVHFNCLGFSSYRKSKTLQLV